MRLTRPLAIYFVVVFIGGALLAPLLYNSAQAVAAHGHGLSAVAKQPFHRYVDRSVLGLALICLWPLLRTMDIKSWRELGFANPAEKWRDIIPGILIGFGSLAIIAALAIVSGARKSHLPTSGHEIAHHLLSAGTASILVAIVEEILFRGALFGSMRKVWRLGTAIFVSSLIYALVHFFQKVPEPQTVTWSTGLAMLPQKFAGLTDVQVLIPKVFVLLVAGIILAVAYQRSGSLFLSIGLHAGWIFWLKSYRFVSTPVNGTATWLWGTDELINGWMALIVLLIVLFAIHRLYPQKKNMRTD